MINHLRNTKQQKINIKIPDVEKTLFCCKPAYHLINYFKLLTAAIKTRACH